METLTLSHDTQKKTVSLNFVGVGKRNVRVGYVIENPIWKTSYRPVLGKAKEDKPFLQGLGGGRERHRRGLEGARMALVSGRPTASKMDLYTSLYVPRPTVLPDLFALLRPVTYNGDLQPPWGDVADRPSCRNAAGRRTGRAQRKTLGQERRRRGSPGGAEPGQNATGRQVRQRTRRKG